MLKTIPVLSEANGILACDDPVLKNAKLLGLFDDFLQSKTYLDKKSDIKIACAGFPQDLEWVDPKRLKSRKIGSLVGRCALIHAVCHIEYNAINLALDALCRFKEMPESYYDDWLLVAVEEAYHFKLLTEYLKVYGYQYGDFPVHNGLWKMALDTAYDVLVRMACVPRLMEARGLDIAPMMIEKLAKVGDKQGAQILSIIFEDEKQHVQKGNHWYQYLCEQRKLDPLETFTTLVKKHASDYLRGPYNHEARLQAGFWEQEMKWIAQYSNATCA